MSARAPRFPQVWVRMARMSARLRSLPLKSTTLTDSFWSAWQCQMSSTGLVHQWKQCQDTSRLENLRRCARRENGGFQGLRFNDSDVYKLLEATSYAISIGLANGLEAMVSEAIDLISASQQADGYINSFVQLSCPEMRWKSLSALHEMYCMGHLIEAAVSHFEATSKSRLLDVAKRCADHIMAQFPASGPPACGDHQELELALVRLSDVTGEEKYGDYARWQVQSRGTRPSRFEAELQDPAVVALTPGVKPLYIKDGVYDGAYAQDDMPLARQTRAVGHAVRAMYFYSGAVDTLADDEPTMTALHTIWDGLVSKQMYVTGGIGSSGRNEGFTDDYDLPNIDAYAETCAGIGLVYWAWRMFLVSGEGKFIDVLERALYNAVLSGVSESCDRYFYDNPLESDGRHERQPWFTCACCPPNIARLVMSIGQYAVASDEGTLYVAIPISGRYSSKAAEVAIEGDYPWTGDFSLRIARCDGLKRVALRRPDWAGSFAATVNGVNVESRVEKGFIVIDREWRQGDLITVSCPMDAKWSAAHPSVQSCAGRTALQRGPLVYCLEQHDLGAAPQLWSAHVTSPVGVVRSSTGFGTVLLDAQGTLDTVAGSELYGPYDRSSTVARTARFVPYFTWANRGPNAMLVWVRKGN